MGEVAVTSDGLEAEKGLFVADNVGEEDGAIFLDPGVGE